MSSGTYTEPLNYATNFNVPLLIHIVVCSDNLNEKYESDTNMFFIAVRVVYTILFDLEE